MPAKKNPVARIDDPRFRAKLRLLYARRSNIDLLIRSLEQYNRFKIAFHTRTADRGKRKTA